MKHIFTYKYRYSFLLLIALAVCAMVPVAVAQDEEEDDEFSTTPSLPEAKAGESIAFGQVTFIIDGKVQKWGYSWKGLTSCCLIILPENSSETFSTRLNDDGMFYMALKPGAYRILAFRYSRETQRSVGRINARFIIPQGAAAVYIGNIRIEMRRSRYRIRATNSPANPTAIYKSKYPGHSGEIISSLVRFPRPIGYFEQVSDVCGIRWEVECSKEFTGVTPVLPEGPLDSFPAVDSLRPKMKWTPANNTDLSYDLIIYEAVAYKPDNVLIPKKEMMKGLVAYYKEDIGKPEHQLEKPLKPNTRYFWSVRVRDNEEFVVSTWSTFRYSKFMLIYSTWGSGAWFTFSTPEN